jgi:hypothetical protein
MELNNKSHTAEESIAEDAQRNQANRSQNPSFGYDDYDEEDSIPDSEDLEEDYENPEFDDLDEEDIDTDRDL